MSSIIAPEPSSSIAGAEAGRFASACPSRPEHPAARRQANTNDRMDSLFAIMEALYTERRAVHAGKNASLVAVCLVRWSVRSAAVRRYSSGQAPGGDCDMWGETAEGGRLDVSLSFPAGFRQALILRWITEAAETFYKT